MEQVPPFRSRPKVRSPKKKGKWEGDPNRGADLRGEEACPAPPKTAKRGVKTKRQVRGKVKL